MPRGIKRVELSWGKTPWDSMDNAELVLEMKKAYSALLSASCALKVNRAGNESHPYWGKGGTGGEAISKAESVFQTYTDRYKDSDGNPDYQFYHAYYRYANQFLFPNDDRGKWIYCPTCGNMVMIISGRTDEELIGKSCREVLSWGKCEGTVRLFTMEDLEGYSDVD